MYLEHFGLKEPPFRITPHTEFFFEGGGRGAMLEALLYTVLNEEGIVVVTGEVGTGKTMLCRMLMERMPAHAETIYVATPSLGRDEILHTIADELKLPASTAGTRIALREIQGRLVELYGAGRRVVILIDEAHAMPGETLEQVRLLSNLESSRHKLMQIVLFGQPELEDTLAAVPLRPLRDRVTHSFHMAPLTPNEVSLYLSFRMRAAGYRGPDVFARRASVLLARASGGYTRRINILADKALLAAYARESHAVTAREAREAIADSKFASGRGRGKSALVGTLALATGITLGAAGLQLLRPPDANPGPVHSVSSTPAPPHEAADIPPPATPLSAPASASEAGAGQAPRLTPGQLQRIAGYTIGDNPLLRERVAATVEHLQRTPDEQLSVVLFFTENASPARLERFLERVRVTNLQWQNLHVVPVARDGRYLVRVFYGSFSTREAAIAAERGIPQRYRRSDGPQLRDYAELRQPL